MLQVITSMFSSFKYDNYFQKNCIYFYYRMLFYAFRRIAKCTVLVCTITVEICILGFYSFFSTPLPLLQLPGMYMLTLELPLSQDACRNPRR